MSTQPELRNWKEPWFKKFKRILWNLLLYFSPMIWPTILVGIVATVSIYFFVLLSPFTFRGPIIDLMDRHRNISFAVFLVLAVGLYLLRSRLLLAYGAIEIVGGIAVGWNTLKGSSITDAFLVWTAFMASIYLLVRGLDNLRQGLADFKNIFIPTYYGSSMKSIADAVKKAADDAFTTNVSRYFLPPNRDYRKPTIFFQELEACEITKQTVSMRSQGIRYEVTIKAPSKKTKRSSVSDAEYKELEQQFDWFKR